MMRVVVIMRLFKKPDSQQSFFFLLLKEKKFVPVYIGDDATDEDAFQVIQDDGLGILVGTQGQKRRPVTT